MKANPYADDLGAREPVGVMAETPKKLSELLNQFPAEQLDQKPAPDKWSVREIMCHLADCEIVFAWRLRLNYEQHHPMLQPFDQDGWAKIYKAYTFHQARLTFDATRMWNLAFIAGLSEEDRKRPARHPERGELTLWTTVETIAGHDLHHLKALAEMPKVTGVA
ncbi:MAG TPA: DinB family protein [Acidobacteriaceae bacterium]|jgi:uncharacterized damage-inducible protein DinB